MKVQVQAPFQVNENLRALIDEKIAKLTTYFKRITSAEVYLKIGESRHRKSEDRIVEIRVQVPGNTLFAIEHSDEFEKALAAAAEKLKKQILKYKEQMINHH